MLGVHIDQGRSLRGVWCSRSVSESPWEAGTTGLPTAQLRKSGGLGKLRLYMGQSDFTPYVPDRDPSEMNGPQMWNGWEEALIPGYSTKGLNGRGVEDARGFEFSGRIRYH